MQTVKPLQNAVLLAMLPFASVSYIIASRKCIQGSIKLALHA